MAKVRCWQITLTSGETVVVWAGYREISQSGALILYSADNPADRATFIYWLDLPSGEWKRCMEVKVLRRLPSTTEVIGDLPNNQPSRRGHSNTLDN